MFAETYKSMNKFLSKILKRTRSEKLDAGEDSHIEVCVNPKIQDKYNLTPKTSPVDYYDMLLPLTKTIQSEK